MPSSKLRMQHRACPREVCVPSRRAPEKKGEQERLDGRAWSVLVQLLLFFLETIGCAGRYLDLLVMLGLSRLSYQSGFGMKLALLEALL